MTGILLPTVPFLAKFGTPIGTRGNNTVSLRHWSSKSRILRFKPWSEPRLSSFHSLFVALNREIQITINAVDLETGIFAIDAVSAKVGFLR